MKTQSILIIVTLSFLFSACQLSNFSKQKFTDLRPLSNTKIVVIDVIKDSPPDSLQETVDTNFRPIYIQTEKKFYYMENPELDTVSKIISASEILRSEEPDKSEDPLIIKISEKDFKSVNAIELNKVKGVYVDGLIVPKDEIRNHVAIDQDGSIEAVQKKRKKNREGLKIGSIILFSFSVFSAIIAWLWYNESKKTDESGCLGSLFAASFLAAAILFAYTAGLFFLTGLILLIVYLAKKNA